MSLGLPKARPYRSGGALPGKIAGRIRAQDRRWRNDAGWWPNRGISDLAALGWIFDGRQAELEHRLDVYAAAGRSFVRTCGMLGEQNWVNAGLVFSPLTPGYWQACAELADLLARRGLYWEWCYFADAQIVVPDPRERAAWLVPFAAFTRDHPGVFGQLANEAFKNGWSGAEDPALLGLADALAALLGHRDFSISDPEDGDNLDASIQTNAALARLSRRSNFLVMHASRAEDANRYRRWVDHLEGFSDVLHTLAPGVTLAHDEPMGASRVRVINRRDNDPDALIAAQMTAACCGLGYTYHWLPEEGDPPEDLPGLLAMGKFLGEVPYDPAWTYLNDSWPGSPTHGFREQGPPGKVRNMVLGDRFWTCAYGGLDYGSIQWRAGASPQLVYDGPQCKVWKG